MVSSKTRFPAGGDVINALLDTIDRRCLGRHLHPHRIGQDLGRQPGNFAGHGSGKKQRLARLGHRRHDLADIVHKAHIEHPVGFIEDQEFDRIEPDMPLLH